MKKLIVVLLILAMLVPLAACGGGKTEPASPGATTTGTNPGSSTNPGAKPAASEGAPSGQTEIEKAGFKYPEPNTAKGVRFETFQAATGEIPRYITDQSKKAKMEDPETLHIGQMIAIEAGNPASGSDSAFYEAVFDSLIRVNPQTAAYEPNVITEWKMADDAMSIELTMADNITFHNGVHATIDDLIYSLQRLAEASLSRNSDKSLFQNIDHERDERLSDYSCKIYFKIPLINFIPGMTRAWLYCKQHIEEFGEENAWWSNTVGSGMYKCQEVTQGDRYVIVRNDDYWKPEKAAFKTVYIKTYAEASTMYIDYETGALDLITNPLAGDVQRIINGEVPNTICELRPGLFVVAMFFNEETNEVLKDINVRKAICMALDPTLVSYLSYGILAKPATSLMPYGVVGRYDTDTERNLEAAKQALADAGYKPGELHLILGTNPQNVNMAQAEAIQAQLGEIGIEVELCVSEPSQNINNLRNNGPDRYDLATGNISYYALEALTLIGSTAKNYGCTSFAAPEDENYYDLATVAKTATDVDAKTAAMIEAQKYLLENYWEWPLIEPLIASVYKDYLEGYYTIAGRCPMICEMHYIGD